MKFTVGTLYIIFGILFLAGWIILIVVNWNIEMFPLWQKITAILVGVGMTGLILRPLIKEQFRKH